MYTTADMSHVPWLRREGEATDVHDRRMRLTALRASDWREPTDLHSYTRRRAKSGRRIHIQGVTVCQNRTKEKYYRVAGRLYLDAIIGPTDVHRFQHEKIATLYSLTNDVIARVGQSAQYMAHFLRRIYVPATVEFVIEFGEIDLASLLYTFTLSSSQSTRSPRWSNRPRTKQYTPS